MRNYTLEEKRSAHKDGRLWWRLFEDSRGGHFEPGSYDAMWTATISDMSPFAEDKYFEKPGAEYYIGSLPPDRADNKVLARVPGVDELAQFIRQIDGKHDMGAGALAERIVEWLISDRRAA